MIKKFINNCINYKLNKIYTRNVNELGFTPNGVFWNSKFNQVRRFREILQLLKYEKEIKPKIADIGCGYGAFYEFLITEKNLEKFDYSGYDINRTFINFCNKRFKEKKFFEGNKPNHMVDFCLMSGTYNFAVINNTKLWERYILNNLKECLLFSKIGIIFNIQFSNHECIVNNIYYCNPTSLKKKLQNSDLSVSFYNSKFFRKDKIFVLTKKN